MKFYKCNDTTNLHFRPSQPVAPPSKDEIYCFSFIQPFDTDRITSSRKKWWPKNKSHKQKTMVKRCCNLLIILKMKAKHIIQYVSCSSYFWKKGRKLSIDKNRNKLDVTKIITLLLLASSMAIFVRISQHILYQTGCSIQLISGGKSKGQTSKPRILRLLETYNGGNKTTSGLFSTVSLEFAPIRISKGRLQKLLRRRYTDWFYLHTDTMSPEDIDKLKIREPFETENCKAMYEWQKSSFPTCNIIHEHQMQEYDVVQNTIQKINYGFFRDIWKVQISTADARRRQYVVLKTLRTDKEYDEYNADRHRRDAVALERLTSSPHVVNIYGHCVNSQMTEYSGEGDVYDAVFNPRRGSTLSKEDALRIAIQVATGIADMHNLDKDGQAPMAHTDIAPTQFILIDGYYKLNDFNRVRFIRWNNETNMPCPYQVMNNPGEVSPFLI